MATFGRTQGLVSALLTVWIGACGGSEPPPAAPAPTPVPAAAPLETAKPAPVKAEPPPKPPAITKADWGSVDGKTVQLYTLTNANGLVMKVTNYGVIITEFDVPDKTGKLGDIVAGYENLDGYLKATPYFGTTVGRIANRIKNGEFQLEGKT
jgi:aldose 1-epimerase